MEPLEPTPGKYVVLISVHGLVRGTDMELGRDADTGGQVKYVVELARALGEDERIERVDLLTRQVFDGRVDAAYAEPREELAPGVSIVRLPCGPRRYLRKEALWPHLDSFADQAIQYLSALGRTPDWIHSHYADAGYVGARMAHILGVPLVHTGHSLGRVKRERLRAKGLDDETIESRYHIGARIEAEELALGEAMLVVASTQQEVDEQYAQYENYHRKRMQVIPPGLELARFRPPRRAFRQPPIYLELARFLRDPRRPMILALSRPDERKNIATLVKAYAEQPGLRDKANLVIVAGNRDDIEEMDRGARQVLTELLLAIDRHDLYGHVAYPRQHQPDDVPVLYRLAARTHGVFVNPALTEPFGLTLIEAAASGVPVLATNDGGPRDILEHCRNGRLFDPLDSRTLGALLAEALADRGRWRRWARNGLRGAQRHYTWDGHVEGYLKIMLKATARRPGARGRAPKRSRLPELGRLLVCDIDNTLLGDFDGLHALLAELRSAGDGVGFAIATGRRLESARRILQDWRVPTPDILITSVGSAIFYGNSMAEDPGWLDHIDHRWDRDALVEAMRDIPGLKMQSKSEQRRHKISYDVDPAVMPPPPDIVRHLRRLDLRANVIFSHQAYLDLLPVRASKGLALRYLSMKWDLPPDRILVAGDSGNDEEMLRGEMLGVVVGNYSDELESLRGQPRVHFAAGEYAWGILEGLRHYRFLEALRAGPGQTEHHEEAV